MYLIFEGLMFFALAGLITVFHYGFFVWAVLLKALTSLFFVLAALCGYVKYKDKEKRLFSGTVLIALLFSMAGDVLLAVDQTKGIFFVLGVVGFAAAHVMFSLSFCRVCAVEKRDLVWTVVLFAGLTFVLLSGDFDFQGLFPVLTGYAAVISFMLVKALSLWRCRQRNVRASVLVMAGGVLFLLSDVVLLYWLFGIGMPEGVQWVNWILYYMAQGCLSASLSV